jgi:glycosyltransferase involved in cell wall biosynthesis
LDQQAPTVTVVIPTFNRPQFLVRAIDSVRRQTFGDFEVVVVIDGFDPASRDAIEQIHEPRLRYLELSEKVGGSEARNLGVRAAKGRWIALLDDDDEWLPNKLEVQLAPVLSSENDGMLVTSRYVCHAPGLADVVRPRRLPKKGEPISEFMFDYLCYFQTSTFLCSRILYLRVPFDSSLPFFQDIDWFLRVSQDEAFKLVVIDEPLSIYHVPAGRSSITTGLNWQARLEWGRQRRHLLSKRAYSRFVVGTCVGRAVQDGAGWTGFVTLLKEVVLVGSATPYLVTLLCGAYLLSPKQRKQLRDRLFFAKTRTLPDQSTDRVS